MYPVALTGFFKDNFNDRRFLTTVMFGRLRDGVSLNSAEVIAEDDRFPFGDRFPEGQCQPQRSPDTACRRRRGREQSRPNRSHRWLDDGNCGFGPHDRLRERDEPAACPSCPARKGDCLANRSEPVEAA